MYLTPEIIEKFCQWDWISKRERATMSKIYWLSWSLLCLLVSTSGIRMYTVTQAKALQSFSIEPVQVGVQEQNEPSIVNLLLQEDEEQQALLQQNVQIILDLLLEEEAEAQNRVFLPLVTR